MSDNKPSVAYLLGRKSAPLILKTHWILKSLTGSEEERIEAEFSMGCLLAQLYEEKNRADTNNRLEEIAAPLRRALRNKQRTYTFKCDQSDTLNALAIPGGFIYISEKLYDHCGEDRDAIAFILAHEIAHIIHTDANTRFLTKTMINALLKLPARGLSSQLRSLLAQLIRQGYSREQEYRADRFACALMKASGYDPQGSIRLFEKLNATNKKQPSELEAYFASHPSLTNRIARLEQHIGA